MKEAWPDSDKKYFLKGRDCIAIKNDLLMGGELLRPHLASPKERNSAQPSWPPPDLLQKRRPSKHSPSFPTIPILIGDFESGE
jgi:hypothetical protein